MKALFILAIAASILPAPAQTMADLTAAAEGGDAQAQCRLGDRYEYQSWEQTPGGHLPPPNMPEALRWYRRSAEQNWADGQYRLGLCYLEGKGLEQDEENGLELIRKAADQNHFKAMLELARLYSRGVGRPRTEADSPVALLQRVVTSNPEGNYTRTAQETFEELIVRFEYGIGAERDVIAAVEWHCRAALTGVSRYPLTKTASSRSGFDVFTPDPERSKIDIAIPDGVGRSAAFVTMLAHYLKAARGDAQSALLIGNRYLLGQDVPRSPAKAWLWFTLATRHDSAAASSALARCESSMTADEVKAAKLRLPEFLQLIDAVSNAASSGRASHRQRQANRCELRIFHRLFTIQCAARGLPKRVKKMPKDTLYFVYS